MRHEDPIAAGMAAAEEAAAKAERGVTLHDSAIQMAQLWMEMKTIGVREEDILDLIRIVFMFAGPSDPGKVAAMVADTGDKAN